MLHIVPSNFDGTALFGVVSLALVPKTLAFCEKTQDSTISLDSVISTGQTAIPSETPVINPALNEKKDTTSLPSILVTAKRFTSYTPSQTIIEVKDFSGKYQDLQSVLETVSGVMIRGVGGFGHYAEAAIRGSSPNQVQIYIDGVPLNGSTGAAVDISKIPLPTLQTISVVKNIPSIEFFGDNAGGVINLSTATSGESETASLEGGSFGYRAGNASIDKKDGRMSHHFALNYVYADNNYPYVNDNGTTLGTSAKDDDTVETMDNNFFSSFSAMYTNVFNLDDKNKLISQLSALITDEGIFYFPQANSNDGLIKDSRLAFIETYTSLIDSAWTFTLRINGKTDDELFQRFKPFYVYTSPVHHETDQPKACAEGIVRSTLGHHLSLTYTLSERYDGFDIKDLYAQRDLPQPHFFRLSTKAGFEARLNLDEMLAMRAGCIYRYERDSTNGRLTIDGFTPGGQSAHEGFPGAFGEITVEPLSGFHLLTSMRYSSRSPGFAEKFCIGANYAGNAGLRPETMLEYDAGFSINNAFMALSASYFNNATKDKIIFTMNSQHMFVPQNMNEIYGWGLENDVNIFPADWLTISNSVTYMENIVQSMVSDWNGNDEPFLPRCTDYQSILLHYKKIYAGHCARFMSPYFIGLSNEEKIVHDKPELSAYMGFLLGNNFDVGYRLENYLNVRDYDFPQRPIPGIRYCFVLKCHFN